MRTSTRFFFVLGLSVAPTLGIQPASAAIITYVDATASNTTVNGAAMVIEPTAGFNVGNESGNASDGRWSMRNFGTGSNSLEVHSSESVAATLATTVSGLAPGTYRVWTYTRTNANNNWDIRAQLNAGPTLDVTAVSGTLASSQTFVSNPTFVVSTTTLYGIDMGTFTGTSFTVSVNTGTAGGGADPRTNYDGVGYELIPVVIPAPAAVPAGLALIALAATRRRRAN